MTIEITDEHIVFTTEATDALENLMQGLSPARSAKLLHIAAEVSAEAKDRFGVRITADEAVTLAGVKSAVLADGMHLDLDVCMSELKRRSPRVAAAIASTNDRIEGKRPDLSNMTPQQRMNWSRKHNTGK
jgi:hypothetical protein